jgi:hypothetical protein
MAAPLPDRADLHRLVDQLTPGQTKLLRDAALRLVGKDEVADDSIDQVGIPRKTGRRLSFAGVGQGDPELAAASAQILQKELGHKEAGDLPSL